MASKGISNTVITMIIIIIELTLGWMVYVGIAENTDNGYKYPRRNPLIWWIDCRTPRCSTIGSGTLNTFWHAYFGSSNNSEGKNRVEPNHVNLVRPVCTLELEGWVSFAFWRVSSVMYSMISLNYCPWANTHLHGHICCVDVELSARREMLALSSNVNELRFCNSPKWYHEDLPKIGSNSLDLNRSAPSPS